MSNIRLFFTATATATFALFSACGSDSTSASDNAGANEGTAKTDTVYVSDTVYVPVTDTVYVPVADTSAKSSASDSSKKVSADSSNAGTPNSNQESSEADASSSSAAAPASSDSAAPASSAPATPASSSATTPASSATPAATDAELLWSDEFDGDAIDESKWDYNIGTGENGWGNNEKEYYTKRPENVYVKDGMLHIRAQKEDYEGQNYTSTRLLTQNKFTFTYGTVEARIALPVGKGIWPAFWMLGENINDVSWPACGEIDIIEAINDESIVYGTHHWAHEGSHAEYGNNTSDYYGTSLKLDISEFHTYKMTWDKEFITMYVDDFKYQEIDIKDTTSDMATFHKPFFFILNVAVGGSWPGFDIDDSQFPTEMQVDYIRVYK